MAAIRAPESETSVPPPPIPRPKQIFYNLSLKKDFLWGPSNVSADSLAEMKKKRTGSADGYSAKGSVTFRICSIVPH